MSVPALYERLIEDAALLDDAVPAADAVRDHLVAAGSPHAGAVSTLVVTDRRLAEVGRAVPADDRVRVTVLSTTGAGGLLSVAERPHPSLGVTGVVSTLRDLDDLAGNARRVVAAAEVLDPEVRVLVGLPRARGWDRAAEEVEAAGLQASVDLTATGGPNSPEELATQLRELVELDLPFRVTGIDPEAVTLPALLLAVEALVEDAGADEAARLLTIGDAAAVDTLKDWDEPTATRVRRRLTSVAGPPATRILEDLAGRGLLSAS